MSELNQLRFAFETPIRDSQLALPHWFSHAQLAMHVLK